jgi:hypothetical protein
MTHSIGDKILKKIVKARHGTIFFADSFLAFGTSKAVNKAMERLVEQKEIIRVATGLYTRPKQSKLLGPLTPGVEEIAEAIRKRDKARIVPTGSYAQNALGLSTQVPMKVVYLTDGAARKVKAGNYTITFKKTTPKNLSSRGSISELAIQALKSIGKGNVTQEEEEIIIEHLKKEKHSHLEHDIRLAPEWIRKIMRKALIR